MKKTELTFAEGFDGTRAKNAKAQGATHKAFDWDKAAQLIKEAFKSHSDLVAEAGLQLDWAHTGGIIFENSEPTSENYTYLSSNWATPTLILSWDGEEQQEIDCYCEQSERFNSGSKWDEKSLSIVRQ